MKQNTNNNDEYTLPKINPLSMAIAGLLAALFSLAYIFAPLFTVLAIKGYEQIFPQLVIVACVITVLVRLRTLTPFPNTPKIRYYLIGALSSVVASVITFIMPTSIVALIVWVAVIVIDVINFCKAAFNN